MSTEKTQLDIGGVKVEVSNLSKVFYPKSGFTKGQVIDYYIRISPYLLPHLKNRPITLKRYPDGAGGFFFYEKNCPPHPKWVRTKAVPRSEGGQISYCIIDNIASLIWAANLADLELHTFLHRATDLNRPTSLAFDLDPGTPADLISCCEVAIELHDLFAALKMECFPKTSGSKGLQVYVPLNSATTYEKTKAFAHAVAELLEQRSPDRIVSKMQKALRKGKVFVDWSQNDDHKTTVNVYSLRAVDRSLVSTPVSWDEVRKAIKGRNARSLQFEPDDVLQRVKAKGDLFEPVLTVRQKLPSPSALKAATVNPRSRGFISR
jgi:bifunctional non-homologous end joining protein LigD